jgi:hypothetical protein
MTLALPIKKADLGNFVADLLGQQQSIERVVDENFNIDFSWLVNLHELIDQRINQQNHSDLVSFSLIIYFENGLKRTLTSVEALKSYSETRKDIPVGVKMVWNYLVHFPKKSYPEKQQISFSAFRHKNKNEKVEKLSFEKTFLREMVKKSERNTIRFQIDHTERTWGDDLEVVISNHIDEVVRKEGKADILFELSRMIFSLLILISGFVYGVFSAITNKLDDVRDIVAQYLELQASTKIDLSLISQKLDVIAKISEINAMKDENLGLLFIYVFISTALAMIILFLTRRQASSFIVISSSSELYREKNLKKERRSVHILIGSFLLSVSASLVANYWYEFFK